MNSLTLKPYSGSFPEGYSCTICLENEENGLVECSQHHIFHRSCLVKWLKSNPSCPCDQRPLNINDILSLHEEELGQLETRQNIGRVRTRNIRPISKICSSRHIMMIINVLAVSYVAFKALEFIVIFTLDPEQRSTIGHTTITPAAMVIIFNKLLNLLYAIRNWEL